MTLKEAAQQSLEALEEVRGWQWVGPMRVMDEVDDAITALRQALEQADEPEFISHEVANTHDWSEWVNPNNDSYMMKCCDCGLVHEMQFKVAKYSEGDECEFVGDADLQPVFRARRAEEAWQENDTAHRAGGLPQPAEQADEPVAWLIHWTDGSVFYRDREPSDACKKEYEVQPLYTHPQREWVGLTDEEIEKLELTSAIKADVKDIEAKLKEKNT